MIDVLQEEKDVNKWFTRKKKCARDNSIGRKSICLNNRIFNIVSVTENQVLNGEIDKLLYIFNGFVLRTCNEKINRKIDSYLFDSTLYQKRAFISSLSKILSENKKLVSVVIYDQFFKENKEYYSLAYLSRRLSVITPITEEFSSFSKNCYRDFGLSVYNNTELSGDWDVIFNLDYSVNNNKRFIDVEGKRGLIYWDSSYFKVNENVSALCRYSVPFIDACAALEECS